MQNHRRTALLLALTTLALYLPAAWFDFVVYDDNLYVTENATVQGGPSWPALKWAFTSTAASNWHPVTWLSHMIDCGWFGLHPAGPHLVNAVFHAANAALLLLLLVRLTRRNGLSLLIAALFAWHPMHVESVAWVSERKDVLSTFFALLSLLSYARHALSGCRRGYWLALLFLAMGLMAKPMLVTLPCVMLLLDFWPLQRRASPRLLIEKIPFFGLSAASCLVTYLAQSQTAGRAVASLDLVSLSYRLRNIPLAYVEYLKKTFWPADLAVFYPLPGKIPAGQAAAAAALLLCITLAAWRWRSRSPWLLTGWLWFAGMLVPVIGLVQVGGAQIADRYHYLPSVGLFIALAFGGSALARRWSVSGNFQAAAAAVLALACAASAEKQLWHWRNSETLFHHALSVTADNDVSRVNLGAALEHQGRFAEAGEQYLAATRLAPNRYQGHHNLAGVLDRQGRPAEALKEHRLAATLAPEVPFLQHSLGQSLRAAGLTNDAYRAFAQAARLDPRYPWPHVETARMLLAQGRDAEALASLRASVRSAPENPDILIHAAQVIASSDNADIRDGPTAFALAAKANLLSGGSRPDAMDVLGMACAEMGRYDEARAAAQSALETAQKMNLKGVDPIRRRLELYQQRKPWRQSFRDKAGETAP